MNNRPTRTIRLWSGCSKYELRLLGLMIAEIGVKRYRVLCEKAKDENATEALEEAQQERFEHYDRMMRGNYNKYAGGKK